MGTNGTAVSIYPPFLLSSVPRPQRALFFRGNTHSQAGKIILFIVIEIVTMNLVKITA